MTAIQAIPKQAKNPKLELNIKTTLTNYRNLNKN